MVLVKYADEKVMLPFSRPSNLGGELMAALVGSIAKVAARGRFRECIAPPRFVGIPEGTQPWAPVSIIGVVHTGETEDLLEYEPPFQLHGYVTGVLRKIEFPDPEWEY